MKALKILVLAVAATLLMGVWVAVAAFGSLYGWWMKPVAPEGDAAAFLAYATAEIDELNPGNSALVLIEEGEVAGSVFRAAERGVSDETVFPTASFSKWMAAMAVMSLVEEGKVDLDAPVSTYLTRWSLPETDFDNDQVTVRRLLAHTSGLTDGLGFGEYSSDETLPSLEESLVQPRASSGEGVRIAVGQEPGAFAYSGGGYLILELMIEDVTGEAYADYVERVFLRPLGMTQATYAFLGDIEGATASFDADGKDVPHVQFASAAATGFSASAADLVRLAQAIGGTGEAFALSDETMARMRQPEASLLGAPIWGLGTILYAPTPNGDFVFGHDGANDPATNVSVRINPETGDGYVMLSNGHPTLASNIGADWVFWQVGVPDVLTPTDALRTAFWPAIIGALIVLFGVVFLGRKWVSGGRKAA